MIKKILFSCITLVTFEVALAQDGSLDATFDVGLGADANIETTALQPDGKILIGGAFSVYNGTTQNRIARLNTDGSLDTSFNAGGIGANNSVLSIIVQPDGKILICGAFEFYNNIPVSKIIRLNSDGSLDSSFNNSTIASNYIYNMALQADGKILIATQYNNVFRRIERLNSDGSLDASFNLGLGSNLDILSIVTLSDGKILIGGNFTSYNSVSTGNIAKLNSDGTLDTSFNSGTGFNGYIHKMVVQSDNKILIGGYFSNYNGTNVNNFTRINADGSIDNSFNTGTGASNFVLSIAIQSDNKILIGGGFYVYNGTQITQLARINQDGSLDNSFAPANGPNGPPFSILLPSDEKAIVAGNFTTYNSINRRRIARILANSNPLSINDPKIITLKYYPNPIQDVFHLESQIQINTITLTNQLGQNILTKECNSNSIDIQLEQLPPGVYIINVISDEKTDSIKVIKK
jgi:uncharacterized delta-60 repeat protein